MRLVAWSCLVGSGLLAAVSLIGCGNPDVGTVGPQTTSETTSVGGGARGAAPEKSNRSGRAAPPVDVNTRK